MTSQPGLKVIARNANFPAIVYAMYCPVYGCTSDSKKNTEKKLRFFSFPKPNSKDEQKRRDIWIEFCKRKSFVPTKCTCLCSLHFSQDAYIPSHSPYFLESINFPGKHKLLLKPNAVPTINKALDEAKSVKPLETKKRRTGILSRRKVSVSLQEGAIIKE